MKKAPPKAKAKAKKQTRRVDEREARMAWILDAALDLAIEGGLESITVTKLAERVGYTVGAFYRYWPSIEALLAALHRRTAEVFYDRMWEAWTARKPRLAAATRGKRPAVAALAEMALLMFLYERLAKEHPKRFELVGQLVTRPWRWMDDDTQAELDALVLPRIAEVVAVMARAAKTGALDDGDPVLRTMTVWVGAHGTLAIGVLAERHPQLLDRDALFRAMVRTLLVGWGAKPADVDAAFALAEGAAGSG